jgi:hypothetical protein
MRDAMADRPDEPALLDQMAMEHAAIGPALETLDQELAHGKSASQAQADLETRLLHHLTYEERDTLPLVDRTLTVERWMAVGPRPWHNEWVRTCRGTCPGCSTAPTRTRRGAFSRRSRRLCDRTTPTDGARISRMSPGTSSRASIERRVPSRTTVARCGR